MMSGYFDRPFPASIPYPNPEEACARCQYHHGDCVCWRFPITDEERQAHPEWFDPGDGTFRERSAPTPAKESRQPMIQIRRNTAYTQAYGCWFCLHIWDTAIYFGRGVRGAGPRLELFTPLHWFRWSRGYRGNRKVAIRGE